MHPPKWKTTEYDIWYWNPCQVIKNILANADFDDHIDYMAYCKFNSKKWQYSNMMSGSWSWQQCVCLHTQFFFWLYNSLFRIPLPGTLWLTAQCSSQSSWGLTKWLFLSPPVRTISTHYISQSETFKTISNTLTRMHWFWLGFSPYPKVCNPLSPLSQNVISTIYNRCQERHQHRDIPKFQEGFNTLINHHNSPPTQALHDDPQHCPIPWWILLLSNLWPQATYFWLSQTGCSNVAPLLLVPNVSNPPFITHSSI